jgi:hypothetical protein
LEVLFAGICSTKNQVLIFPSHHSPFTGFCRGRATAVRHIPFRCDSCVCMFGEVESPQGPGCSLLQLLSCRTTSRQYPPSPTCQQTDRPIQSYSSTPPYLPYFCLLRWA